MLVFLRSLNSINLCCISAVSSDGKALLWDCGSAQCLATVATLTCEINSCSLAVNSSLVGNHASSLKGKVNVPSNIYVYI